MVDLVKKYKCVGNPFIMESIDDGTDSSKLEYHGRGESVYAEGRQVLVRSCNDALVAYEPKDGERGIILIRRKAEPAKGYLWPLGGEIARGIPISNSLASRVKIESGLDVDEESIVFLGQSRAMWGKTPHPNPEGKNLPLGIDDACTLFYCEGRGNLNLDELHESPLIVIPEMYASGLGEKLHEYVKMGMDRAIPLLMHSRSLEFSD